ncbi:DnaD domain protein [Sulfoacidibacillus thermotolerans]|uniref:Uncharacterized protein n=1 Tax=Sulfoacidibacillus thermotolerans TaxID=1765684 RepID=A0A2U3D725_SULT2|nr:DnaD domain protein [Sulfoacidibacillus thermotolerans]PWI57084.1 hypothetical protein BM613_10565 [Sulfoacidibacillus thermotolerans]
MSSKPLDQALDALEDSYATFPYILFRRYHSIGLSDEEFLVILHIIATQQAEHSFPRLDDLALRMSLSKERIAVILQGLMGQGLLQHGNERVSLRPLIERLLGLENRANTVSSIYNRFEEEFGRLLSPLEYEQIMHWIDEDQYPDWMIIEALRESVLAGVYNFRYVDTVLTDWMRAHIKSEQQLQEYRKKYRARFADRTNKRLNTNSSNTQRNKSDGMQEKKRIMDTNKEQIVPAVQPGKYERFYEVFRKKDAVEPHENLP